MLEHRRNGWYLLGGTMMTVGAAWLTAWSVAVASASRPDSLHFLNATTIVAAVVLVVGALIVFAMMYDWLTRLGWLYPGKTRLPLKVVAGKPHFHEWNYAASVVALPITVTNRTSEPMTLAGGCQVRGNMGDIPSWRERLTVDETGLFLREIESQNRSSHHRPGITDRATIPAHATLEFWYVTDVSRDQRGVELNMTLHFKDGEGNGYSVTFERIAPQQIPITATPLSAP